MTPRPLRPDLAGACLFARPARPLRHPQPGRAVGILAQLAAQRCPRVREGDFS